MMICIYNVFFFPPFSDETTDINIQQSPTDVWPSLQEHFWWFGKAQTGTVHAWYALYQTLFQLPLYNTIWCFSSQATNNLLVLAKEEAGASGIYATGGVDCLMRLVDGDKERDLRITAIRVLACMAKGSANRVSTGSNHYVLLCT